jgi:hypothetical protein
MLADQFSELTMDAIGRKMATYTATMEPEEAAATSDVNN